MALEVSRVTRRPLVTYNDLPLKVRKDFDYIEGDDIYSPRFAKYRNAWYDVQDTQGISLEPQRMGWAMLVTPDHPFAKFHALITETFFSGILFRFIPGDDESVLCARYWA